MMASERGRKKKERPPGFHLEVSLPLPEIPRFDTTQERVSYLARLMAEGRYAGRRTAREIGKAWGLKQYTVSCMACEASRQVKITINPSQMLFRISTELERLEHLGRRAEREGDIRGAIVASTKRIEYMLQLINDKSLTEQQVRKTLARQALVQAGWTPPRGLPGLPQPPASVVPVDPVGKQEPVPHDEDDGSQQVFHAEELPPDLQKVKP